MLRFFRKSAEQTRRAAIARDGGIAVVAVVSRRAGKPVLESQLFPVSERNSDWAESHAFDAIDLNLAKTAVTRVIDPGAYQLQLVETPNVPPEEMRQALAFRVKDFIDFPSDDAVVDYLALPPHINSPTKGIAYAVIARKDEVDEEASATRDIGLHALDVLDIPETALRNIAALLPNEDQGVAFLHFTHDIGYLTITRKGELHLIRQIKTGRKDLIENADDEFYVTERAAGIALEVQRSLDYYESHYDYRPITELVLGPGLQIDALPQALSDSLGLKTTTLDLHEIFKIDGHLDAREQAVCLIPAGAALQTRDPDSAGAHPQSVNLLKEAKRLPLGEFPARMVLGTIAAMLFLMVGVSLFADYRLQSIDDEMQIVVTQEAIAARRLENIRTTIAAVVGEKSWDEQLEDALEELGQRRDILKLVQGPALGETEGFARHLRAMSRQDIDGIWLTFIGLSGDGLATRIEGRALKAEFIPMYVQNLTDELPFSSQRFQQFEIDSTLDPATASLFFSMDSRPMGLMGGGK